MNSKMTPCEKLGYKVGDKFKASKSGAWFNVGEEVELWMDDGSNYPYFFNARMPKDSDGGWPRHIESVEKISNAKLKPAKQALADAINQNGGWVEGGDWHKSGELPPVGEVCLYVVSERRSTEVEITAHAKFGLCFVEIGKSGERYVSKTAELHRFIPICTERDKAIDEMMLECQYAGDSVDKCKKFAIALYDAGYRKEVE